MLLTSFAKATEVEMWKCCQFQLPMKNERRVSMTKKKVGAIAVIAFVGALGIGSFAVGLLAGEAHKTIEKRLAFKKGFEKGKSCKIGALGVPLGTKCVVFGWLDRPSPPLKKRDDADNVFYLKVESVNGKECMATLRVLLDKDEATKFCGQYEFVGYETIMAEGVPAWLNEGEVSTMDYFLEHYFVITDSPRNGTAN